MNNIKIKINVWNILKEQRKQNMLNLFIIWVLFIYKDKWAYKIKKKLKD